MPELHVPDVSEFQRDVDWAKVVQKNGGAAIIRVLYGSGRVDKLWTAGRRDSAHKHGVKVLGIYQYLRKDEDPLVQAQGFVSTVGTLRPGEFAVLDLEEGAGDQSGRAKRWLDHVDAHLTYPGYHGAWLYSNNSIMAGQLHEFLTNSHRNIWIADYGAKPTVRHVLWQHTDGKIACPPDWHAQGWPGIGRCDCSVFEGTLAQLQALVHA